MEVNRNNQSFTVDEGKKLFDLKTPIGISLPFVPNSAHSPKTPIIHNTVGLWDTGATGCAITKKAIDALGIKPIGSTPCRDARGSHEANVYLINLYLPNNIIIPGVRVTECTNETDDFGILIGMNVITLGDFSITNVGGQTTFSFRVPSIKKVDFTKEAPIKNEPIINSQRLGRNDLCHCGSNKKFKNCHGNPISKN